MDFACTHCDRLVGVSLQALLTPTDTLRCAFVASAQRAV
jgi:hypothetical protein